MTTQLFRSLRIFLLVGAAVSLAAIGLSQTTQTALAHTRVEVGPYALVVGWREEPPIVGERNALTIEITENEQPVTGAAATLDAEVLYGGRTWRLNLNPTETPGLYSAALFPTVRGQYTMRLFGSLPNADVDVQVDPEEVLAASTLHFPQPLPDTIALQDQVNQLQAELQSARTWAFIASGIGGLGVILALVALLRRRSG